MPHLISASRRTDIPAFYADWFAARLEAGFAEYRTAYGPQMHRASLLREDVNGFVFWTKNALPFENTLARLTRDGWPWTMHYTVTGLPRKFEPGVPGDARTVASFKRLAKLAGPDALWWRYDPIVISESTPPAWHVATFTRLADRLAGSTREVFLSFVAPYARTKRNMAGLGVDFDPPISLRGDLTGRIVEIAEEHGMTVNACCNPELLAYGAQEAQCISPMLLKRAWDVDLALPVRPSRKHCRCVEVRDIGMTDTCQCGCLYCYANVSPARAAKNAAKHDPQGSGLVGASTN